MQYETCLKIDTDGKVIFEEGNLYVSNANHLTIYHVAATDYTSEYPKYKSAKYFLFFVENLALFFAVLSNVYRL